MIRKLGSQYHPFLGLAQTHLPTGESPLNGQTPLHSTVRVGDVNIVKLLISKGANINAVNKRNRTPLDLAKKFPEIVELLKKHGAKE